MTQVKIYPRREFEAQTAEARAKLVAQIEAISGDIPMPYRQFLIDYAGGFPWPNSVDVSDSATVEALGQDRFAASELYNVEDVLIEANGETYGDATPKGYVFVADAQGGWHVLMRTQSSHAGGIYLWPHTAHPWGEKPDLSEDGSPGNDESSLYKIAESFGAFLEMFTEDPSREVGKQNWEMGQKDRTVRVIEV